MSSKQDAIRLYSSSDEEDKATASHGVAVTEAFGQPLYVANPKDSSEVLAITASDDNSEDGSETEEKASTPPAQKRSLQQREATDVSTVPTNAEQIKKQHRPKPKNVAWPTRRSRKKRHQARRAPVRYGNYVAHVAADDGD
jgi:hypothetical protein